MRILLVTPSLKDVGGVANYYRCVLPLLRQNNQFHFKTLEIGRRQASLPLLYPIKDQLNFFRLLKRFKPDLVHFNPSFDLKSFLREGFLILQCRFRRIPFLIFFRGWQRSFEKLMLYLARFFFRTTFQKAKLFLVLDSYFKNRLKEWGVKAPILLTHTVADDRLFKDLSLKQKLKSFDQKQKRVLFLARLHKSKGITELLQAFKYLKGEKICLTIAGSGPEEKSILKSIKTYNLTQKVRLIGYADLKQKRQLLKSHQLFCLPSRDIEGMANALLEAMAAGLVLIATPVCGLKYLFSQKKIGQYVQVKDPRGLAQTIKKLALDSSRCKKISRFNFTFAQKNFTPQAAQIFLIRVYKRHFKNSKSGKN